MLIFQRFLTVYFVRLMMAIAVINFITVAHVSAFEPTARFHHIKVGDGLPHHSVTAMTEDTHGFIWFGTLNGLVRFDGYRFINFGAKPLNGVSLLSQNISALYADEHGAIWIGTWAGGLSRLDVNQAKLINYSADFERVYSIEAATDGHLYLATDTGVKLIPIAQQSEQLTIEQSWLDESVRTVLPLNDQLLMVGTESSLLTVNIDTSEQQVIELDNKDYFSPRQLLRGKQGEIWLASTAGLYYFPSDDLAWVKVTKNIETPALIYSLALDRDGSVWAGSSYHGIYHIENGPEGSISQYQYDKTNRHTIADNTIMSLLIDKTGMLWIGTFNDGISNLDVSSLNFGLYLDNSGSIACLPNPAIHAIMEQQQYLWLGTQTGAVRVNRDTGECQSYLRKVNSPQSLPHPTVSAFYQDSHGHLWLGTGRGIVRFDEANNNFVRMDGKLANIGVNFITEDDQQRLLVGTYKGLYLLDEQDNFRQVKIAGNAFFLVNFHYAAKDQQGKLWFATSKGLAYFDQSQNHVGFVNQLNEPIFVIHIDEHNEAWVAGKDTTLIKINLNNKLLIKMTNFESLPQGTLFYGVLSDHQDNLWWSTSHGLWRYNRLNQSSQMYHYNNGLASDNFNPRAVYSGKNGRLYFGSRGGLNYFDPQNINLPDIGPDAMLTGFSWFNHDLTVELTPSTESDFTLPSAVSSLQQLTLSHQDKIFAFEFAADDFSSVKDNTFAYRLVGLDDDWTYADANARRAMYNNVPAGSYQFEVKAANKNGIWGKDVRKVAIEIKPAPWLTPLAFVIYAIIVVLGFVVFIRIRTASLTNRAKLLQQKVTERTFQLDQEKQRVEELLKQKSDEFANVSHEFRTPLTLVLGPVAQLLKTSLDSEDKRRLNVVKRNGFRLLRMVDQLLHLEKFRVQQKQMAQTNVVSLYTIMSLIAQSFADLAEEQQVDFIIEDIADVYLRFTPDSLEKIILNLISNALKYTLAGGTITIGAIADENQVVLRVVDTGIGIAPEQQQAVFRRFHRVLDEHSEQVTGAGIGLALVKELVGSHQGQIRLESELGKGTAVFVTLPIVARQDAVYTDLNQEIIELELASFSSTQDNIAVINNSELVLDSDKPTVLIVEDNPDMRSYIYESLCEDYQCVLCANGQLGYQKAVEIIPDIVVSDVMMPKMDGFALTKALKSDDKTSHIPVVLLTARDDKQSRLQGWHEKADEYLTKPFDNQELVIRINNLLAIRDILRDRFKQSVFVSSESKPQECAEIIEQSDNIEAIEAAAERQKVLAQQQAQKQFLQKLDEVIEQVYTSQSVTVGQIAKQVALGERQLFRKLKATVGMNPTEYLRRFRLQKACDLLAGGMNSSRVALEVGFSSHSYFTRCFSAQYGFAPSQYIQQQSVVA